MSLFRTWLESKTLSLDEIQGELAGRLPHMHFKRSLDKLHLKYPSGLSCVRLMSFVDNKGTGGIWLSSTDTWGNPCPIKKKFYTYDQIDDLVQAIEDPSTKRKIIRNITPSVAQSILANHLEDALRGVYPEHQALAEKALRDSDVDSPAKGKFWVPIYEFIAGRKDEQKKQDLLRKLREALEIIKEEQPYSFLQAKDRYSQVLGAFLGVGGRDIL